MIETPAWLETAFQEDRRGVAEIPGPANHARILEYHRCTTLKATSDAVPWCAAGACFCLERNGYRSPRSARARDFLRWGIGLVAPAYGCIVVLARGPEPWPNADTLDAPGHVGFLLGRPTPDELLVFSANVGDRWIEQRYPVRALLGYRWPRTTYEGPNP
jgi:uncharacterized protein (TIGR02594 family)